MIIKTTLSGEELKEILCKELKDFKSELLKELKAELVASGNTLLHDRLVRTSEICQRWGRSRTTISKLIKAGKLIPAGKYKHSFTFRVADVVQLFGEPNR